MSRARPALFLPLLVLPLWLAAPAAPAAQGQGPFTGSGLPMSVDADNGMEWRRKEKIIIARGNAVARQGRTRLRADELRAFYRTGAQGRIRIWKVMAAGRVQIRTGTETATGETATYLLDTGVFVLRGPNLKLWNRSQTITATDRIEFHNRERRAHVIGDARIVEGEKTVRADRFIAHMKARKGGAANTMAVRRVEALGNVVIATATEIVRAERGDYDTETRLATMTGRVRLTRCDDQLNGEKAVVDLATGVSRMVGRVRGLLVPDNGTGEGCRRSGAAAPAGASGTQ